jgi:2-methylcitrate dehydratase
VTAWAQRLAEAVDATFHDDVPEDVLRRTCLHVLDTIACAAGAVDAPPVDVVRRTVAASMPEVATVFFSGTRANVLDAVLVNGTAARFLDANDVFLGAGPGGHPSDNIPAALNVAEVSGASGRDVLAAIAIGYDLVARLRRAIYRPAPRGSDWHEVSLSGVVVAATTSLLRGACVRQLSDAIAIGAAKGYALKEIRRGQISMLKAVANAMVARDGVLAADLAMHGMAGPPEVFEGGCGLVRTLGAVPTDDMIDELVAAPEWAIRRTSIKPYAAIGTSQAAIAAAVAIVRDAGPIGAHDVRAVTISLPDTRYTREYVELDERRNPTTRESADHSIQFLVALALLHGDVLPAHLDAARWRDDDVAAVMDRTTVTADAGLVEHAITAFPAAVSVDVGGRGVRSRRVISPPGSPSDPWSRDDLVAKFRRLDPGRSEASANAIADAAGDLIHAPDVSRLMAAVA